MAWRRRISRRFYPSNLVQKNGIIRHICNLILSVGCNPYNDTSNQGSRPNVLFDLIACVRVVRVFISVLCVELSSGPAALVHVRTSTSFRFTSKRLDPDLHPGGGIGHTEAEGP